jgi:hypothetical protein
MKSNAVLNQSVRMGECQRRRDTIMKGNAVLNQSVRMGGFSYST